MATNAASPPPPSPLPAALNPQAAVATSHLDQLEPVEVNPNPDQVLPSSTGQLLADRALAASSSGTSTGPGASDPYTTTALSSASFPLPSPDSPKKPHPADLISLAHPDPHPDTPEPAASHSSIVHSSANSRDPDESRVVNSARTRQASVSENGAALSHASHGGGGPGGAMDDSEEEAPYFAATESSHHADDEVLEHSPARANGTARRRSTSAVGDEHDLIPGHHDDPAQDKDEPITPLSFASAPAPAATPTAPTTNGTSTPRAPPPSSSSNDSRRLSRTHGRSQSVNVEPVSRRPPSSDGPAAPASVDPPPPPAPNATPRESERSSDKDKRGDKRDKEREREREKEKEKESTRSRRVLGEWTMSKTLGAGSMGKVKLGISSITGEKVAIKIIPRFTSTAAAYRPPPPPPGANGEKKDVKDKEVVKPTASFLAKAAVKDQSKEVRTMREGSICLLLHHPYVCGMKSMVLYPHHYYMVFEYVNGGQMLDYIISHGRLRERSARKFARQIGSALEYCHANSIVHRDLKIENILISKTGNIKIIDFGLSNLYSPSSHLNTFCGSLYFAAPELLNAKLYTGPEVDVWSFGIVLYVLVCGKVPFDDQSMPALHAKIKRGQVEYPTWLSTECKHLLSRMLVTNPAQRATLAEVLSHPWMIKGFSGPPSAHLPPRVPLRLEDVSRDVIKGMVGFEFGSEAEIEEDLTEVLTSDVYRAAVRSWEAKRAGTGADGDPDVEKSADRPATRVDGKDMKGIGRSPTNRRFSGLGFYGKKLAGGFNAAFAGSGSKGDDLDSASNGSTSTLIGRVRPETLDPTRGFHPLLSIYFLVKEKIEREKIWGPGVFASSTVSLTGPPPPPAPALAYQAGTGVIPPRAPELAKSSAAASAAAAAAESEVLASPRQAPPTLLVPMTPQPRPRATGDELPRHPSTAPPALREGARSSFSAGKRSSMHETSRPHTSYEPTSPSPNRKSFHASANGSELSGSEDVPLSSPTSSGGFARRFGSLLGRSTPPTDPSFKGHRQRASIGGTAQHKASNMTAASALPQVSEGGASLPSGGGSDVPLPSPLEGEGVHRASTVGELSPNRHQRGVSMGAGAQGAASLGRASGGPVGQRRRQISLGSKKGPPRPPGSNGAFDERAEELVETEGEGDELDERRQQDVGFVGRTASPSGGGDGVKPVWLKGLFSVSTTSTKPSATIRADLIKVLDRLGVQHRDVKSGFECAHVPSIDLSSVGASRKENPPPSTKGTMRRKASKLLVSSTTRDSASVAAEDSQVSLGAEPRDRTQTTSSTSFTIPSQGGGDRDPRPPSTPAKFNSSTLEGSVVSNELIVRFEVFVVRMPLLPGIHGLQFRRIAGNAWQYQMLARRILSELKL